MNLKFIIKIMFSPPFFFSYSTVIFSFCNFTFGLKIFFLTFQSLNLRREKMSFVRSHIGSKRPEPGPYKCMLTLTSKTRFRVMRGCQKQTREGNPGGSLEFGWTGRPKTDNILLVGWGVIFGIRAEDGSS